MTDKEQLSSTNLDNLFEYLRLFNFSYDESKVYKYLLEKGKTTAWTMSTELNEPRTNIYRTLEKLNDKGFVIISTDGKTNAKRFEAVTTTVFQTQLLKKKQELDLIEDHYEDLMKIVSQFSLRNQSNYEAKHYKGIEGYKQVTWNSTKAKSTFRIFEIDLLHSIVDKKFAESMRREFAKLPIQFRQLTNRTHFEDYTKVTGHIKQWSPRYISKKILDIKVEIQTYNNVVCMYDYKDSDIFIIEIYHDLLANMFRQMFDSFWTQATPMKIISPFGATEKIDS